MEYAIVEVPVGNYHPDGRFEGERIQFDGREVGVYDGGLYTGAGNPDEVYGFILRLYECPDGYRVHELIWSPVAGRSTEASLYPIAGEDEPHATYMESQIREHYGEYFRAYFESR
jgi:hypothetical protein